MFSFKSTVHLLSFNSKKKKIKLKICRFYLKFKWMTIIIHKKFLNDASVFLGMKIVNILRNACIYISTQTYAVVASFENESNKAVNDVI